MDGVLLVAELLMVGSWGFLHIFFRVMRKFDLDWSD